MEILNERERTHGQFANVAQTAQAIKAIFNPDRLTDVQREAIDLIATKLARIAEGDPNLIDHWEDIAGYATLVVRELLARGTAQGSVSARTYPSTTTTYEPLSQEAIANIAHRYGLNGGTEA